MNSRAIIITGNIGRRALSLLCILVFAACSHKSVSNTNIPFTTATPFPTVTPIPATPTPTQTATLPQTSTPTPSFQVTLDAVGDIMLARSVGEQVLAKGPQVVFAGVQSTLDSADIRVGNLECAITQSEAPEKKTFPLRAPPETARALAIGKFDVLSVANNHAMDYGYAGLVDTQKALSQFGIASVGAGVDYASAHTPIIVERNGLRLAFLAYANVLPENSGFDLKSWVATDSKPGIAWADPAEIAADVRAAKQKADLVMVLLHSGYEIGTFLPVISLDQREAAQAAIDAGAVLVVGSHPHVLEKIEEYHGGLIAYSLGNFVFDQYKGIADATIILQVVLNRSGVVSHDYVPVLIENGLPSVTSIENERGVQTLIAP